MVQRAQVVTEASSVCTTRWSFQRTLVNGVLTDWLWQNEGEQVEFPSNARDDCSADSKSVL